MRRSSVVAIVLALVAAGTCGGPEDRAPGGSPAADSGDTAPVSPVPGAPPDSARATGPAGAVAVLREYYAAIQARDYARAYGLWSGEGTASGQTAEEFASGYGDTRRVTLNAGAPGRVEGAAGSRYVEVPVTVAAETSAGGQRCFRGAYVLRRSEVPGATEEQRAWRIFSAGLRPVPALACDGGALPSAADSAAAVIRDFGARLASVSLLAPPDVLERELRTAYGPLVTVALLDSWLRAPASAPGREVSSPWPERIEIETLEGAGDDAFRATAAVVYVSSTDAGTGDVAERRAITVDVVRTADGWRIADVSGRTAGPRGVRNR